MVADTARIWAIEMLHYVATVRPDLSTEERLLQLESLQRFRTHYFDRIKPSFEESWKRGILFESLVLSDPRFPERSEIEKQVSRYLLCALANDIFLMARGRMHYPDHIEVEVQDGEARVVGLVEIKSHLAKYTDKTRLQLGAHINNLMKLEASVNQYLREQKELPACYETTWPDSVTSLVVPAGYDRVLFKPAEEAYVEIKGWQVLPALFTWKELRVVSDFLWHVDLGKEAEPSE